MTFRLTIGIDPGQTGCLALLADGEAAGFIDMPTMPRRAGGHQIDPYTLGDQLRAALARHPGAAVHAVIEQVNALPKQGSASGFRFGQSDGIARGVVGSLRIPLIEVPPQVWKRNLGLTGCEKDVARTMAIQRFPSIAGELNLKKHIGRADALLIALWAERTEAISTMAKAA